jgi:hypothetical protein
MLNRLYKSQIDGFNQMCEDRLKSPEVLNESNQLLLPGSTCQHLKLAQNKRSNFGFGRSQSRFVRRQKPQMFKQMTGAAFMTGVSFMSGATPVNGGGNINSGGNYGHLN